jgi:hypothetical protein
MQLEQQRILQMVADGVVSAGEGARLLQAMDLNISDMAASDPVDADPVIFPPPPAWAQHWLAMVLVGTVVLFAGLGFTFLVIGGTLGGWWLLLTLPLLLMGSLAVLLGYFCSSQRWLHLHVDSEDARFKFSLPLPFSWITGIFRMVRMFEPKLSVITDDILDELAYAAEGYFYVEVDEMDKDEYVQIYYA